MQKIMPNLQSLDERDRELIARHKSLIVKAYIVAKAEIAGVDAWDIEDDQAIDELRARFMKMAIKAFTKLPDASMPDRVLKHIDLDKLEQAASPAE